MDARAPAFPQTLTFTPNGDVAVIAQYFDKEGVSIRTYIATKLMAAIISNANVKTDLSASTTASLACEMADALIAELSKS